jgi:hypothetical protein
VAYWPERTSQLQPFNHFETEDEIYKIIKYNTTSRREQKSDAEATEVLKIPLAAQRVGLRFVLLMGSR